MRGKSPEADQLEGATNRAAPRGRWRLVALLGVAVLALWILPALRGRGPYGRGLLQVLLVYAGVFAALAWPASLAVALAPARYRRALAFRLTAALGALAIAVPLGDLASTLWSVRVRHFWYYSQAFSRRENTPDPELIWKRKPGLAWRGRKTPDCDEVGYRTDENGFRNPPGIRRADVVVVGDSVTEAGEVDEGQTFVRKVGTALGLVAVNLGTSGYGPQQELAVLRRYGLAYGPRLVVWQVTEWNDLLDADAYRTRQAPAAGPQPSWEWLYARHSPVMRLAAAILPGRLPNTVVFRGGGGRREAQMFWPYEPEPHRRLPGGFAETTRAIAAAFDACRARGIDFVVLYVPSHVRVLLPYLEFESEAQRGRFCPGGVADREGDLSHALAEFCGRLGCPMIDMAPPLRRRAAADPRRLYIRNDPHLGVDGHDEVQKALVGFVESRRGLAARGPEGRPSR